MPFLYSSSRFPPPQTPPNHLQHLCGQVLFPFFFSSRLPSLKICGLVSLFRNSPGVPESFGSFPLSVFLTAFRRLDCRSKILFPGESRKESSRHRAFLSFFLRQRRALRRKAVGFSILFPFCHRKKIANCFYSSCILFPFPPLRISKWPMLIKGTP